MLYSYYMKINILAAFLLFTTALLPLQAQNAQAVVVKQDGDKIYLDISSLSSPLKKGDSFKIITASEPLINPQTGKNLGDVYQYSPEGTITEVQPLYAVGEIKNAKKYAAGAKAVLESQPEQIQTPAAAQNAKEEKSSRKIITYQPVEQTIVSLTEGNVTAPNQIITLSDKGQVTVYSPANDTLTPVLTAHLPAGTEPIAISAVDVKKTGASQLFASYYNPSRKIISTSVLEAQNENLETTDTFNSFVKEIGCSPDKTLWGQTPFVLGGNPGNARKVLYNGKKFELAKDDINTRREWLNGINFYPYEQDKTGLVYITSSGTLKAQTGKERWAKSKSLFSSTPNRVKYKQDVVKFYPSVQVYQKGNTPVIVAAQNTAKLGLLADLFGQYKDGKIHFLNIEKGRLVSEDTVELDGYVYDTACTQDAILTAETLEEGYSSIKAIAK